MSLIRWEPFREMDEFFRQLSPLFNRSPQRGATERSSAWAPAANISETEKEYLIKAELPEVPREDVRVTLDNGVITISGERKQRKEASDENEIRVESFYGTFTRSFSLPENVDAGRVRAESKDGVLKVHIPKKEVSKPKQFAVQVQ